MSGSRTQNAKRNIWSGILNKIITLALPFVIRTIIIQKFGAEYLGLSSLFTSILQVLNMAELGFSSSVVFSLYKPLAEKKIDEVCALMSFYRLVYKVVGSMILGLGLILMPFLPHMIKGSYPEDINLYILYLIYLVNTVISYFAFAYKSVLLTASQRQDVINNMDSIMGLCRCTVQIVVLLVFSNYYIYVIWNIVFMVVNNIVIATITKKRFPDYICRGKLEQNHVSEIVRQIKGLAIGKFSLTARNSFDSVVLSMFCGLVELAIYSNYYYVFNAIIGFISVLIQSLAAGIGNSIAVDTIGKNYFDFKRVYYIFSWIGGWCTICLFCLYQPFMYLWAGESLVASPKVMLLFCIYFYITQMGQVRSMYAGAAGIWWEFRYYEIAEMLLNLVLNFTLGWRFGMEGILWATIITVFIFSIIGLTRVTYRCYFKRSSLEYFIESAKYILSTIIGAIISFYLCLFVDGDGITSLLLKGIICLIVPNLFFAIISTFNKTYRMYLQNIMNKAFNRN